MKCSESCCFREKYSYPAKLSFNLTLSFSFPSPEFPYYVSLCCPSSNFTHSSNIPSFRSTLTRTSQEEENLPHKRSSPRQIKMPGPAFYITTVSGGTCVEKAPAGLVNKDCDGSSPAQQWTIQYKDNDPSSDTVAFQNAGNGEWMRATSGAAYGKIDTTASQQWWTLIKGRDTGSVWIKCNDYPDAYLCNANGSYVSNNTVYVWPKQVCCH